MLKELVKLANKLDEKGMHKESDLIDSIIQKIAIAPPSGSWAHKAAAKKCSDSCQDEGREVDNSRLDEGIVILKGQGFDINKLQEKADYIAQSILNTLKATVACPNEFTCEIKFHY